MNLFALLLLAVAVTHYGVDVICALFPSLEHASRGLFYAMRGVEGLIAFLVIGYIRPALWAVCLWGAFEEGQTAACRLSYGFGSVPSVSPWTGLCGEETHLPLYMMGIVIAALLVRKVQNARSRT